MATSYFRKLLPKGIENFVFFLIVLQILLVLSGTIELNPGPDKIKKTKLSFAVWNLDSIPAHDYARITLIETFQSTYNFDIFGVCESFLSDGISNEDILINGFSPDPLEPTNLEIVETEEYVYIVKRTFQLRKGAT